MDIFKQDMFDFFANEHNITLLDGEMNDIIHFVHKHCPSELLLAEQAYTKELNKQINEHYAPLEIELVTEQAKNKKLVEALEDIELECNKGQDNIKKSNNHHDGMIYGLGHLQQIKDYIHLFSKYLALNEVNK